MKELNKTTKKASSNAKNKTSAWWAAGAEETTSKDSIGTLSRKEKVSIENFQSQGNLYQNQIDTKEAIFGKDPAGVFKKRSRKETIYYRYQKILTDNHADCWKAFLKEFFIDLQLNKENSDKFFLDFIQSENFDDLLRGLLEKIGIDLKQTNFSLSEFKNIFLLLEKEYSTAKTSKKLLFKNFHGIPLAFVFCNNYNNSLRKLLLDKIILADSSQANPALQEINFLSEAFQKKTSKYEFVSWEKLSFWKEYPSLEIRQKQRENTSLSSVFNPFFNLNLTLFGFDSKVYLEEKQNKGILHIAFDSGKMFCGKPKKSMLNAFWSSWEAVNSNPKTSKCSQCESLGSEVLDRKTSDRYIKSLVKANKQWRQVQKQVEKDYQQKIKSLLFYEKLPVFNKKDFIQTSFQNNITAALEKEKIDLFRCLQANNSNEVIFWTRLLGEENCRNLDLSKGNTPQLTENDLLTLMKNAIDPENSKEKDFPPDFSQNKYFLKNKFAMSFQKEKQEFNLNYFNSLLVVSKAKS